MISIVLPVHVYDSYAKLAIDSMLVQTFSSFELILVANGKDYEEIASKIADDYKDSRIVLLKTPIGQLSFAVNFALTYANYDLVARMDADDISHPDRLKLQYEFLENNKLDMVGSDLELIDEHGNHLGVRNYPKGKKISKALPFKNPFAHNTVLFRKSIIFNLRGYNSGFNTEDYDLWLRMLRSGNIRWDNMESELVSYRIHTNSTQRQILSYAEASGLALRECILDFGVVKFSALVVAIIKCFVYGRR
ncbi:MAG: glycosyltransferase [Gammaproteobacteria bacterium]|nr:glycosyltransferase [Gammaproteobacteria bacterium]